MYIKLKILHMYVYKYKETKNSNKIFLTYVFCDQKHFKMQKY